MCSRWPRLLALRGGDLAAYHGVEHKAIAAYEQGDADAADAAKEHDRCGSNLVAPMLASNVAGTVLLHRVVERPGTLANGVVAIGSIAAAVEVFAWSERHAETRLAKALRRPGYELQRAIGTREPTESSSTSGAPRSRRSCASRLSPRRRRARPARPTGPASGPRSAARRSRSARRASARRGSRG